MQIGKENNTPSGSKEKKKSKGNISRLGKRFDGYDYEVDENDNYDVEVSDDDDFDI